MQIPQRLKSSIISMFARVHEIWNTFELTLSFATALFAICVRWNKVLTYGSVILLGQWLLCFVSPSVKRTTGWTSQELLGTAAWGACHSDDVPMVQRVILKPDSPFKFQYDLGEWIQADRGFFLRTDPHGFSSADVALKRQWAFWR